VKSRNNRVISTKQKVAANILIFRNIIFRLFKG